uniref:Adenylate kinase active site lid domain-containing protein n=1 Tax=Chromera velia CCMP2878 TaxID=1169474 RepID=A0A0G4I6Y0_9ALVE|mmetsp:Transcript_16265/g.32963  ORF Transcript_16265/g.32963 Transcript_16265/m.32963 type:complete len:245 (-) Transcript_16265:585-1319(-)|eukprot:Cvel_11511.t1-p1 / transcript=Cvel_11511.t1 / gene=Cvel_11511 / organism=Chromera_velia_CCMP2878 / gene_product=Probable adenylate kinase 2, chloroplastic, putative / transcript_product=Probable adenylate kinase 2, chloroplastic, putative / location=Cvel_scaffold726:4153-4972(-) / protein_length=244 / sequence_SO=supercontig / SO=protein_coding / is_pseudo=false
MGDCGSKTVAKQVEEGTAKATAAAEGAVAEVTGQKAKEPLKIIIAGAPASGKGTQCEVIVEKCGVTHISTGDLLRDNVKRETELGLQAKEKMENGALVPDELIIELVKTRLAETDCVSHGWLLDGFPRTAAQADALEAAGIRPDKFVILNVPDDVLVERVVGRRTDPETGKIYHMKFNPPPEDVPVERLTQRADDNEETVMKRVAAYHEHVAAILGKYGPLVHHVDGNRDKGEVSADILEYLHR